MRSTLLAVCLFLTAFSALAQERSWRLERIVVEGSKFDDDIVRAEARLPEEREYTDSDFRQALYRIRRLPFVADATYRIEPGVTAGGSTLIIRILDVTPAFYDLDLSGTRLGDGDTTRDGSAFIGGRVSLHNLGLVEFGVQDSDETDGTNLGVAYRAYDILGTGGFGSVVISQRLRAVERDYSPQLVIGLGYPLTQRQTVTLSLSRTETSRDRDFDVLGDDDNDDKNDDIDEDDNITLTNGDRFDFAMLRWWYESIDDPFFATRGVRLSAGPYWANSSFSFENFNPAARRIETAELETSAIGAAIEASAYRRLFGRTVGILRVDGNGSRNADSEVETMEGTARAGLGFDFHRHADDAIRPFKARVELGAGYRMSERSAPGLAEISDNDTFADAAFVMRHRWGRVRLSAIYVNEE